MYPLIGLDPADVREAFSHINTTDNDEWAAAFSAVADRYMTEGNSLLSSNPAQADKNFVRAWRLYSFARWPVPASAGKETRLRQSARSLPRPRENDGSASRSRPHPL